MDAAFERAGAVYLPAILESGAQDRLAELFGSGDRPGRRLTPSDLAGVADLLTHTGLIGAEASRLLGKAAFPVRALVLEKSAGTNWQLGLHQDRTIAVRDRADVPGFGPWTVKDGQPHVQPPQEIIDAMVTLRVHLDPVTVANGPLEIVPGSHRLGRLSESQIEVLASQPSPLVCLAEAGDIWAYRTAIVHGSAAVRIAGTRRRVLQIDYACTSLPPPLEWAPLNAAA